MQKLQPISSLLHFYEFHDNTFLEELLISHLLFLQIFGLVLVCLNNWAGGCRAVLLI